VQVTQEIAPLMVVTATGDLARWADFYGKRNLFFCETQACVGLVESWGSCARKKAVGGGAVPLRLQIEADYHSFDAWAPQSKCQGHCFQKTT
jgi:hypothetical protein